MIYGMRRLARLDVPNVLQHVMARGIEGRDIFQDKNDRQGFLKRLSEVVTEGNAQLFAWCLMSNHFHLLFRPRVAPLANMMRRLLTGYAVDHNRRHGRKGHLFQNRYKSVVVEEDPYFLELVRYIHLNPVRGGIIREPSELKQFPYTGHAVITGKREFPCQDVDWVLQWFGKRAGEARREYCLFVEAGFDQGSRDDLRGGGLIRSAGGREKLLRLKKDERELGDDRILGSGAFVEEIVQSQLRIEMQKGVNWEDILKGGLLRLGSLTGETFESVTQSSNKPGTSYVLPPSL